KKRGYYKPDTENLQRHLDVLASCSGYEFSQSELESLSRMLHQQFMQQRLDNAKMDESIRPLRILLDDEDRKLLEFSALKLANLLNTFQEQKHKVEIKAINELLKILNSMPTSSTTSSAKK